MYLSTKIKNLSKNNTTHMLSAYNAISTKASLLKGMSEFWEGEVSLVCRKIILIHCQNPGV